MINRVKFLGIYAFCWILLFQFFRGIFFLYHHSESLEIGGALISKSAQLGLRMDISFAAYILMIPTLLIGFTAKKWNWYHRFMNIYSLVVGSVISILTVCDLELFKAWGFRIDSTIFTYLNSPAEAMASAGATPVFGLTVLLILIGFLVNKILITITQRAVPNFAPMSWVTSLPTYTFLAALLIIPIRGGLQQIPMNVSNVFFSNKSFANHAAVNLPWNFVSSILHSSYEKTNPFAFISQEEEEQTLSNLYKEGVSDTLLLKNTTQPNVLIIIWESLTAKVVSELGGAANTTPNFSALTKEGILFTNMYASGNRSDKGMVAILSGYPAQPHRSIIKIPTKTQNLPSLPKVFKDKQYSTAYYYGGESEFANMKSYFLQQGYDKIIDKHDFQPEDMNSKWGAHDHVVLNKLLQDLNQQKSPFFTTVFTLSSHEPFEVPVPTVIKGKSNEKLFLNAHHYTDASIGDFIKKAKKTAWWNNTLVVIMADHGHPLPENPKGKANEFHIPMLWLGGVVEQHPLKIDTLCSQTDFAATLLNQLQMPSQDFKWSNDIFRKNRQPFAYFSFPNAIGWVKPNGYFVRDNLGGNIIERQGEVSDQEITTGKTYLQASFADYLKR
jgi:phosphoglycerol transferase MdoB-like AlkP superfamily enzyme